MGKLWQRNYHEHIIRNEKSYQRISDYIIKNPAKWTDDKFYRHTGVDPGVFRKDGMQTIVNE